MAPGRPTLTRSLALAKNRKEDSMKKKKRKPSPLTAMLSVNSIPKTSGATPAPQLRGYAKFVAEEQADADAKSAPLIAEFKANTIALQKKFAEIAKTFWGRPMNEITQSGPTGLGAVDEGIELRQCDARDKRGEV